MAAWMKKSGWFVINYDIIVPNNEGGGVQCWNNNALVETTAALIEIYTLKATVK